MSGRRRSRRPVSGRDLGAVLAVLLAAAVALGAAAVVFGGLGRNGDGDAPPAVIASPTTPPAASPDDPSPTPEASATPTPEGFISCAEEWQAHEDEALGLGLCHPEEWEVRPGSGGFKVLNPEAQTAPRPDPGTGSAVVEVAQVPAEAVPPCDAPEQMTLDGHPAERCALEGGADAGVALVVTYAVEPGDGVIYLISAYLQDPGAVEKAALVDQIADSLTFQ